MNNKNSSKNYFDMGAVIEIGCRIHGPFFMTPNQHLAGFGCPVCDRAEGRFKGVHHPAEDHMCPGCLADSVIQTASAQN